MRVYLDNAATTPLEPAVFEAMTPYLKEIFGNPSSIHSHGREVRAAIEKARKTIASLLNTSPAEIFFTSGGTEADNTAIVGAIRTYNIKHALTSPAEHHAVLHTLEVLAKHGEIELTLIPLDEKGHIDMAFLEQWLKDHPKAFVSLMHANNEIATVNDIEEIGVLCRQYGAIYHTDTVQTMGHFRHNLKELPIDFLVGSAHKFHGPKGVGFLYVNNRIKIEPFIHGGAQERNMRGGTENVASIIGLAKALEIAYADMTEHQQHIIGLKARMIAKLRDNIEDVRFNGDSESLENSLYTVLNVSLPAHEANDMLLFNLDINKISASGGSACSSGSNIGSHVLGAIGAVPERAAVRFSFSKYNTVEEIDRAVEVLASLYKSVAI